MYICVVFLCEEMKASSDRKIFLKPGFTCCLVHLLGWVALVPVVSYPAGIGCHSSSAPCSSHSALGGFVVVAFLNL